MVNRTQTDKKVRFLKHQQKRLHEYGNVLMTKKSQHKIPQVVFVTFIGIRQVEVEEVSGPFIVKHGTQL